MGLTRRDIFWLGFFGCVLAAWAALYLMTLGAGVDLLGRAGMWGEALAALCTGTEASVAGVAAVWGMWGAMSVAMMGPTLVPMLATYQRFAGRVARPVAGQVGIVLGFLGVWLAFSILAAAAQVALSRAGLVDARGVAATGLQGGLLLLAGAWQFSAAKMRCQSACLSPMSYFIGRFREGLGGGLNMGLEMGRDCLGCCWAIMALGFVGGVMNLAWMGVATVLMVLEKLPGIGQAVRVPLGILFCVSGVAVWAWNVI